jgi:hypothetical protein
MIARKNGCTSNRVAGAAESLAPNQEDGPPDDGGVLGEVGVGPPQR